MIVILQMTNDLEPWEPLPSGSKEKNNVVLSQVRCQEYSTTGCIPSDLSNVLQSLILHRQSFNGWVAEMCLRWNRSKGRGKRCNEWSEIILKRTNTSDARLANAFSDQTDLSLNWCASCRAMKEAPRDAVTHRHTCKSQFPLCFLLVEQELRDVLNLLLERARLRARCAALGLSCCGPQPGGW